MVILHHCVVSPSNESIAALLRSEKVEKNEDITCEDPDGKLLHLNPGDERICDGITWHCKEGRDERTCDFHTSSDIVFVTIGDGGQETNRPTKIPQISGTYDVVRDNAGNPRFYQHSEGRGFIFRNAKVWTISFNKQINRTTSGDPSEDNKNLTPYFVANESEPLPELGWKDDWGAVNIRVSSLPKSIDHNMLQDFDKSYDKTDLQTEWVLCTTKMTDIRNKPTRLFISNTTSTKDKKCDGTWNCEDGKDEQDCGKLAAETLHPSIIATSAILVVGCFAQMIQAIHKRTKRQGCCKKKKSTRRIPKSPKAASRENPNKRLAQNAVDSIIEWVLKSANEEKENKAGNENSTTLAEQSTGSTEESSSGTRDLAEGTSSSSEKDVLYRKLHRIDGGIKLLAGTGFCLLSTPTQLHILAELIYTKEKEIHDDNDEEALRCMRRKGHSSREITLCLDHIQPPGCLKKIEYHLMQRLMNWILGEANCFAKFVATILVGALPVIKMSLYTFDFAKDSAMAAYLYFQRWTYIAFPSIKMLIVIYGLSIVVSGAAMCWTIQSTKDNGIIDLNKIKKGFLRRLMRILLCLLTPIIPLSILFKSVSLTMKMKVLVANWRNNKTRESPSAAWMKINVLEREKKNVKVALSQMKSSEANLEGNFQLFVLVQGGRNRETVQHQHMFFCRKTVLLQFARFWGITLNSNKLRY